MMRTPSLFLIVGIILFSISSCKLADIRTTESKENYNKEKGLEILNQMAAAHHLEKWDDIKTYSLNVKDEYFGFIGNVGNPFPKNKADMKMDFIPKTFTGRAIFQTGKWKGKLWGIYDGKTYTKNEEGNVIHHEKNNKKIAFWVPTYQYFIEVPNRIFEADIISYAGERELNGKKYYLVYATWRKAAPQKDIDQYMLWINQENNHLELLEYTVRDEFKWFHATLSYEAYHDVDGLLIPKKMIAKVYSPDSKKLFHETNIDDISFDVVKRSELEISK